MTKKTLFHELPERFAQLKAEQPWVLELAGKKEIASYLGISVGVLEELMRG